MNNAEFSDDLYQLKKIMSFYSVCVYTVRVFLLALLLMVNLNLKATHNLTYPVYFENEYIQGPWSRIGDLEESNYKYLAPEFFEDILGTEQIDLVKKMLFRLKERKPEVYNWNYEIIVRNDTVLLSITDTITQYELVKNEITATLTLNGFKAIIYKQFDRTEILTINDLTVPYFDLVDGNLLDKPHNIEINRCNPNAKHLHNADISKEQNNKKGRFEDVNIWFLISVFFNIFLLFVAVKNNSGR